MKLKRLPPWAGVWDAIESQLGHNPVNQLRNELWSQFGAKLGNPLRMHLKLWIREHPWH